MLSIFNAENMKCYVVLKLQNVSSATGIVKGPDPEWEEDFTL